jgi:hypothetical protein
MQASMTLVLFLMVCSGAGAGCSALAEDSTPSATPGNRNELKMKQDQGSKRARVAGVKSRSVGAPKLYQGSQDPNSEGSSMGLGVSIPLDGTSDGTGDRQIPSHDEKEANHE